MKSNDDDDHISSVSAFQMLDATSEFEFKRKSTVTI